MQLVIRVDDLGWNLDKKPDLGFRLVRSFHEAMSGLPYLGAVIPSCVDLVSAGWLKLQPKGLTVALHGWNHKYSSDGCASEFRSFDLLQCRERISRGLLSLNEIKVDHMVLPFNAYEPDLAEACYLNGIRHIWGGGSHDSKSPSRWPTPPQPYSVGRTTFVPSWAPTYAATLWRMGVDDVPLCETLPGLLELPGKAVLTLHITWEAAKCNDFRGVRWLVDKIGDRVITAAEYLL